MIDLRKNNTTLHEQSEIIANYMGWEFQFVEDWNTLIPVVQKVTDDILGLHDGRYCDADIILEHGFADILHRDVDYVRNIVVPAIEFVNKEKRPTIRGKVYRLTAHNMAIFEHLRDAYRDCVIGCSLSDNAFIWVADEDLSKDGKIRHCTYFYHVDGYYESEVCNHVVTTNGMDEMIEKIYHELGEDYNVVVTQLKDDK